MNPGLSVRRVCFSILLGLLAGAICAFGGLSIGLVRFTAIDLVWVFLNRAVMG